MAVYRLIAFMVWFGIMFALITAAIAVALVFAIGTVVMGLVMPSRTVGGQLRSLYANTEAGIAHVKSLRGA